VTQKNVVFILKRSHFPSTSYFYAFNNTQMIIMMHMLFSTFILPFSIRWVVNKRLEARTFLYVQVYKCSSFFTFGF